LTEACTGKAKRCPRRRLEEQLASLSQPSLPLLLLPPTLPLPLSLTPLLSLPTLRPLLQLLPLPLLALLSLPPPSLPLPFSADIAFAAVADDVAVVADVAFAAEVSVTTAVVVTVAIADAVVASVCAADSASPTMSASRHDQLGRAHSTAEDAQRGRPLLRPVDRHWRYRLWALRSTQLALGEGGKFSRSHMHVVCSWEVLVATRRAVTCSRAGGGAVRRHYYHT
jgi:hypothetical protein